MTATVTAAGGAVWRRRADGEPEVLLIHRGRYDDWSLPKGKSEPGEGAVETARREVEEETGLRPEIGPELTTVEYKDHRGRDKTVRYWAMAAELHPAPFVPNEEVDEIRWCTLSDARALLSYLHDSAVIDDLEVVCQTPRP